MTTEPQSDQAHNEPQLAVTNPEILVNSSSIEEPSSSKTDGTITTESSIDKTTSTSESDINDQQPKSTPDPVSPAPTLAPTPDKVKSPSTKKPRKRLTLQERLAQAAKARASPKSSSPASTAAPGSGSDSASPRSSLDGPHTNDSNNLSHDLLPSDNDKETVITSSISVSNDTAESFDELSKEELVEKLKKSIEESNKLRGFENDLNKQVSNLKRDLNDYKDKLNKSEQQSKKKLPSDQLQRKLEEKEKQVKELLEEGSKLSMKEVSLTQTIKRMKQRELDSEEELNHHEKENEILNAKIRDLEDELNEIKESERSVKEERLEHSTLLTKFEKISAERDSLYNELKELKFKRLDVQLANNQTQLDDEIKLNSELTNKLDKLTNQFNLFKEESKNLKSRLEYKLEREKSKYNEAIEENSIEVKRLENKVEALRSQSESVMDKSVKELGGSYSVRDESSLSIDVLQSQYTQAQENWKLIESSYLKKITNLENDMVVLKQKDVSYSKKIKTLTNDLKMKSVEASELIDNESSLRIETETLRDELNKLIKDNDSTKKQLCELQKDYESEKTTFENRIQSLEEEKSRLAQINKLRIDTGLSQNSNTMYLNDLNSSNSLSYYKPQKSASSISMDNIGFGESSTTPRVGSYVMNGNNRLPSMSSLSYTPVLSAQEKIAAHQNSMTPYEDNFNEDVGFFPPNPGFGGGMAMNSQLGGTGVPPPALGVTGSPVIPKRGSSSNQLNRYNSRDNFRERADSIRFDREDTETRHSSTIGGGRAESTAGAGTTNIQIVSKLSTHIRRLELELLTLKEEISDLAKQKQDASNEIIKLLKENEHVNEFKDQLSKINSDYETLSKNYDATLQLLGEKSEKCSELEADVDDLKDLLRQQVNQMVDMQEKLHAQGIN